MQNSLLLQLPCASVLDFPLRFQASLRGQFARYSVVKKTKNPSYFTFLRHAPPALQGTPQIRILPFSQNARLYMTHDVFIGTRRKWKKKSNIYFLFNKVLPCSLALTWSSQSLPPGSVTYVVCHIRPGCHKPGTHPPRPMLSAVILWQRPVLSRACH